MPTLAEHQFRVAAVAKQICESVSGVVDTDGVVEVCLLHDMGNIIKFDLNYFPDFLKPEGQEYWQSVKDEYIQKYGVHEHIATEKICEELGLPEIEMNYLKAFGFSKIKHVLHESTLEQKICLYSDLRVGPHGVLSIEERLIDGRKRYQYRKDKAMDLDEFGEFANALRELEKHLFAYSSIEPGDITDLSIKPIISEFKQF